MRPSHRAWCDGSTAQVVGWGCRGPDADVQLLFTGCLVQALPGLLAFLAVLAAR
ncbi:MAG: hypothetical protein ACR2HA_06715 [Nocardioides sp.]